MSRARSLRGAWLRMQRRLENKGSCGAYLCRAVEDLVREGEITDAQEKAIMRTIECERRKQKISKRRCNSGGLWPNANTIARARNIRVEFCRTQIRRLRGGR